MAYKRTVNELRQKASIFWPTELSRKAFEQSVIPLLLDTQEQFIAFLTVPLPDIDTLLEFINRSSFAPHLFLKHLVVLTDFGGEMLQRVNQFYDVLFPAGTMEYKWGQERKVYRFKALPIKGQLTTARLGLDGSDLLTKTVISGIEVSFQVTTNSTIERKAREARAIFEQVEKAGHRIAYVLDGAGNLQRRAALENLCTYSHCTIAFSREEFEVLCAFLREFLQE